jgi:hypothetical protein
VPFLTSDGHVASLDGLAAAVRRGDIGRAAIDRKAGPESGPESRGNGDVDRP